MQILGISGSLRRGSYNSALVQAAANALPPVAELGLFGDLAEIPAFSEDLLAARPTAAATPVGAIAEADGVLIATPEYNSSIPGALKNALDWVSRPLIDSPLRNKPSLVIGASVGPFGAVWAQADTRNVLTTIAAAVMDAELAVGLVESRFDELGVLIDKGQSSTRFALS